MFDILNHLQRLGPSAVGILLNVLKNHESRGFRFYGCGARHSDLIFAVDSVSAIVAQVNDLFLASLPQLFPRKPSICFVEVPCVGSKLSWHILLAVWAWFQICRPSLQVLFGCLRNVGLASNLLHHCGALRSTLYSMRSVSLSREGLRKQQLRTYKCLIVGLFKIPIPSLALGPCLREAYANSTGPAKILLPVYRLGTMLEQHLCVPCAHL